MSAKRTCGGDCCVAFFFTTSHQEMEKLVPITPDQRTLKDMLVPLTREELISRRERFGIDTSTVSKAADDDHWWMCRHWDEDTGLCGIYETRPKMCRDFPYASKCEYGCSHRPPPSIVQEYIDKHATDKARPK